MANLTPDDPRKQSDRTAEGSPAPPERLLTVMDVAHYLGISRDGVFALLRSGELQSVLIRKRSRRITPKQLAEYIDGLTSPDKF